MNTMTAERPLERATVTVQYVNPAKGRGKSGSIKDVDGQYFGVRPEKLADFAPGGSYEVEFTSRIVDGVLYRNVTNAWPAAQAQPTAQSSRQPASRPAQAARAPMRQSAPVEPPQQEPRHEPVRQPTPNGNGNQYYRPTAPKDARRMFLTATLGHFIETGRVDCKAQSIADAMVEILGAYDSIVGQEDQA